MIEFFLAAVLVSVCMLISFCLIQPKNKQKHYKTLFENKGYTVLIVPFDFMGLSLLAKYLKDGETGDAFQHIKQKHSKYDVVVYNIMHKVAIDLVNVRLIKDFYVQEAQYIYPKSPMLLRPFLRKPDSGIVFLEGNAWKRKRHLIQKAFNFDLVKGLIGKIVEICDYSLNEVEKSAIKDDKGFVQFRLVDYSAKAFGNVVMEGFLGGNIRNQRLNNLPVHEFIMAKTSDQMDQLRQILPLILGNKIFDLGLWESHRRVNRYDQIFCEWGLKFIRDRTKDIKQNLKQNHQASNVIQALIMNEPHEEKPYTDQQILQDFGTFLVAGIDTTSHFFQMMTYLIVLHPQVENKVRQQISQYMQDDDYSYDNLKKLKYLENVQKEAVRYSNSDGGLFLREANQDNFLDGVPITKGTMINIMFKATHYSEKYFKNPTVFRPERWESECNQLPAYAFGGFSFGGRACIGKQLAMIQSKIALIKFLKRYSQIQLGKTNYRMKLVLAYQPEPFTCKMKLAN